MSLCFNLMDTSIGKTKAYIYRHKDLSTKKLGNKCRII